MSTYKGFILGSCSSIILAGFAPATLAQDAGDVVEIGSEERNDEERLKEDLADVVISTGSRAGGVDLTANTQVITAEEIKELGVSTAQELLTRIPMNLPNVNTLSSQFGINDIDFGGGAVGLVNSLGVAGADLRGAGAGNTLVLVDGRRVAGAAGLEDGIVNLGGIPLSAIERVEIIFDGAASIYGSDALGGVINFITKKDFSGGALNGRYENGSNGGDRYNVSAYYGTKWRGGSASIAGEYRKTGDVRNADAGWTTNIYCDRPEIPADICDNRNATVGGQPGLINTVNRGGPPDFIRTETIYSLAPGADALTASAGDVAIVPQSELRDFVPLGGGADSEFYSFTANLEQELFDGFRLEFNSIFSWNNDELLGAVEQMQVELGLDNPYLAAFRDAGLLSTIAPFGATAFVNYAPIAEVADGRISDPEFTQNKRRSQTYTGGFTYDITRKLKLEGRYTRSSSTSDGFSKTFDSLVRIRRASPFFGPAFDATNPNHYVVNDAFGNPTQLICSAFNSQDGFNSPDIVQAQCAALLSSDPAVAFNPFAGEGPTVGAGANVFFTEKFQAENKNVAQSAEIVFSGVAGRLPAGDVRFAVGGEWRSSSVDSAFVREFTFSVPEEDVYAAFGEISVPVLGGGISLPGVNFLQFNASARYDRRDSTGAVGTVDNIRLFDGGTPIIDKTTFDRVSPAAGVAWGVTDDLTLRARWSTGFKAPAFTRLFDVNSNDFSTFVFNDPFFPGFYEVDSISGGNPDLEPETSVTWSAGATWAPRDGVLQGLRVEASYILTTIKNEASSFNQITAGVPLTLAYSIDAILDRDPVTGQLTFIDQRPFNVSRRENSSYQINASYYFDTDVGEFEPSITFLNNTKQSLTVVPGTEAVDTLGETGGLDDHRIVGELRYTYDELSAFVRVQHTPSYTNLVRAADRRNEAVFQRVESQNLVDLTVNYNFSSRLRAQLGARNLLDAKAPFVFNRGLRAPYDPSRWNTRGRVISFDIGYEF